MRTLLVLCVLIFLTACSTVQADIQKLGALTEADVATALATAQADQDQAGINCWSFMLQAVKQGTVAQLPKISGAASAIEAKRHFTNNPMIQSLPTQINLYCAALFNSEVATLGKLAKLVGGASIGIPALP